MIVSDAQKVELVARAMEALIARERWPDEFPAAKDGSAKKVQPAQRSFALACWAHKLARDVVYVIENEGRDNGGGFA